MATVIQKIEALNERLERARQLVADGLVSPVIGMESHYVVRSSDGDGYYLVNGECSCPDAEYRSDVHSGWCKHFLSVELFKESESEHTTSGLSVDERARDDIEALYGPQEQ